MRKKLQNISKEIAGETKLQLWRNGLQIRKKLPKIMLKKLDDSEWLSFMLNTLMKSFFSSIRISKSSNDSFVYEWLSSSFCYVASL